MKIPFLLLSKILLLLILHLAICLSFGCRDQNSQSNTEVIYGGQYYPEEFVLKGSDFWSAYDQAVTHILFQSATEGNQALLSGEIDVVIGSDSKTVTLFSAIKDQAIIIGTSQKGDRYSTVVAKGAPYKSWKDLKGKKVATKLGTGAEQVLLRYFDTVDDVSWDDFEWINLGIKDMAAQLEAGNIEAFTAWEPTPAIAEAAGIGSLMMTYGFVAPVPVCLTTTKEFLAENRAGLVNFLAAHMDKAELIKTNPEEAAKLAATAAKKMGSEVSEEAFKLIFSRIDFSIDFDETIKNSVNDTAEFLVKKGKIETRPELIWNSSLLEEAQALRK